MTSVSEFNGITILHNIIMHTSISSPTKCLCTHISIRHERQEQPDSTAQKLW